eukprot:gene20900-22951_t
MQAMKKCADNLYKHSHSSYPLEVASENCPKFIFLLIKDFEVITVDDDANPSTSKQSAIDETFDPDIFFKSVEDDGDDKTVSDIRNDIQYHRRRDLESPGLEAIFIEIFIVKSRSILLCFAYRPPDNSAYNDRNFAAKFQEMLELATSENKETILAGDLNCNYLVPNDHKEIKDALRIKGFKQLIQSPTRTTRKTKTLIDIIATMDKTKICNSIVHANSFSDHDLSGIVRKMHVRKFPSKIILSQDFSNYNKQAFKEDLQNVDWAEVFQAGRSNERINLGWDLFKQKLTEVIDRHAPIVEKRKRGRSCTWLSKEIKQKMHERDYHLRKARQSGRVAVYVIGQLTKDYRDASLLNSKTWQFSNGKQISPQINLKFNVLKFRTIELNEITTTLRSIKVSKAAGQDNLPASPIRDGAEQIAPILHFLANQSLRSGSFPNSEKCARLTPIHKSGEKSNFDNFRPISVLNMLSEVLERLVHRQLSAYLERNNLFSCSQFGFRGKRSTQHAEWEAVGRILLFGYREYKYFPMILASAFTCFVLFSDVPEDMLLQSFYLHLAPDERVALKAGIDDFENCDQEEFFDVLGAIQVQEIS